jgi:AraC family transcriptional regulator of arabinose operon
VNDLAQISGLSTSRLQHLFKQETGMRIGEYVKEIQLTSAKKLLLQTNQPLKEIGESIGITDPANLCRYFRERFRCDPSILSP